MFKHDNDHDHEHDRGLAHDLALFGDRRSGAIVNEHVGRRRFLKYAVGIGVTGFVVAGTRRPANGQTATSKGPTSCIDVPEETAGPFPGDGTNGPDVLTSSGVVRSDIRPSFGSLKGIAAGAPLTITLALTDSASCAPAAGYAVYIWHADQAGRYSIYSSGVTDQNYLRGVQVANDKGEVTFTTVFPGCYDGRWPHVHFEVFPNVESASDAAKRIATSQLAFPKDACVSAYAAPGYSASVNNLKRTSIESDMVFGDDGAVAQLATVTGTVADGFVAILPVSVSSTVKSSGGPGGPRGGKPGKPSRATATTSIAKRTTKRTTKPKATTKRATKK